MKKKTFIILLAVLGGLAGGAEMASAGVVSPVQSPARPFGLDIVGPVQLAGSDARAAGFQASVLPAVQGLVDLSLVETQALSDLPSFLLDPSQLMLLTEADARVYFVGEGAGYHNTLGFNTQGGGVTGGDPKLIFPDASSMQTYLQSLDYAAMRTPNDPLLPGDFVDLGRLAAGTRLDFFLIANGVYGGQTVYSTDASLNQDGLEHVIALHTKAFALNDSPYLILGFEDLWGGGDQDFNDLVFAVDVGARNVNGLVQGDEPSTVVLLGSFLGLALYLMNRRTNRGWSV
ncbi:DUF4114 domain-containing protein [bacterium]|nr:DUF4114 domain-containing protein [bacterium]